MVFFSMALGKNMINFQDKDGFVKKRVHLKKMMRAMNIRRSLSPLHDEWKLESGSGMYEDSIMECMKTLSYKEVVFPADSSQLVKIVSAPKEWPTFTTHFEEFHHCKEFFTHFGI